MTNPLRSLQLSQATPNLLNPSQFVTIVTLEAIQWCDLLQGFEDMRGPLKFPWKVLILHVPSKSLIQTVQPL